MGNNTKKWTGRSLSGTYKSRIMQKIKYWGCDRATWCGDNNTISTCILRYTWNLKNCAFIRLDKPEYVPEKNPIRLSTKQKEELIYILTSESKYHWTTSIVDKNNIKIATGYEVAVQVWTDTYEENNKIQYDKNGFPVMPDYTRL